MIDKIILENKYNNIYYWKECEKMKITGKLTLNYKNKESALLVYNSLEIDNENYLESEINDKTINYEINSKSLGSFLATVDDLIASEIVAEKILEKTNKQ